MLYRDMSGRLMGYWHIASRIAYIWLGWPNFLLTTKTIIIMVNECYRTSKEISLSEDFSNTVTDGRTALKNKHFLK